METTKCENEKQERAVDVFLLHARIKRLGVTQKSLAKKLGRKPSSVCRALDGENRTLLERIERKVAYLERKASEKLLYKVA